MIAAVIDRLRAQAMPPLKLVDGLAQYARLEAPPPSTRQPAAYVMPLTDVADPNGLVSGLRQAITSTIGVIIIETDLRDARGASAAGALVAPIQAIRAALVGWRAAPDAGPLELRQGRLIDITEGALAWQEEYSVARHLRAAT